MAKKKLYDESGNEVKAKGGCLKWLGIAILILIAFSVIGNLVGGDTDSTANDSISTVESQPVSTEKSESSIENESLLSESTESNVDVPREYKNALKSAQNYVDIMNFSEAGLYKQLTSEYGDQYPDEAAQYAIENVEVDYNKEASGSANNYQDTIPMSDQELFDQLTSEYGDQFTPEQAQYAIDNLE